ncbi:MAG: hypothetical protein AAF899_04375 [Pseudomonadota bacterium]
MRGIIAAAALAAVTVVAPAAAQDFSTGSEAKSWNLIGEQKARFEGKVVDILCELTGDCPADCGAGSRQLGVVRSADDRLIIVAKNGQPAFNGATDDLLPYCNAEVEVDGLMVGEDEVSPTRFFQVQLIRRVGEAEFSKANRWTKVWAEEHPEAAGKGPWFRRDPAILSRIERDGYLGLGADNPREAAFIEEWLE